jgi:hypothetical protein
LYHNSPHFFLFSIWQAFQKTLWGIFSHFPLARF